MTEWRQPDQAERVVREYAAPIPPCPHPSSTGYTSQRPGS